MPDEPTPSPEETPTPTPDEDVPTPGPVVDWVTTYVPENLRDKDVWKKYKSVDAAIAGLYEAQQFVGSSIRIPDDGADADTWDKFYEKLGRPATSDAYDLNFPSMDDAVEWDDGMKAMARTVAHTVGLSPKNAQKMVDVYAKFLYDQGVTAKNELTEELKTFASDMGPTYERAVGQTNQLLMALGGEELLQFVEDTGIGREPIWLKAMFKVADQFVQDKIIVGDVKGVMSRDDAVTRINELRSDPNSPLHSQDPTTRRAAAEELSELYKLKAGVA